MSPDRAADVELIGVDRRGSIAWAMLIIACVGLVSLAIAEQGGRGARLGTVPSAPLPFPRHEVMGVDLRAYSSLEALRWLEAAGPEPFALVAIAVDPDIVSALGTPEQESAAINAMDQLVQAGQASPIAICLWKPPNAVDNQIVAQAAVDAIIQRYPDRIAYIAGCGEAGDTSWQQAVSATTNSAGAPIPDAASTFVPIASGARLKSVSLASSADLTVPEVVSLTRGSQRYTLLTVELPAPPDQALVARAARIINDVAIAGLIMAAPTIGQDPASFAAGVRSAVLPGGTLPEGFSSVTAPGVSAVGAWNVPAVGTVRYARTTANDAAMSVEFVGTEIYVQGLASPDGGRVLAWIDPDTSDPSIPPDAVLDFKAAQAADTAIRIGTDLPADRHRLVILAQPGPGQTVSISGFVAAGSVMPLWTTRMAAVGLLGLAIASAAERAYSSIQRIRVQSTRPSTRRISRHPRVFNRNR